MLWYLFVAWWYTTYWSSSLQVTLYTNWAWWCVTNMICISLRICMVNFFILRMKEYCHFVLAGVWKKWTATAKGATLLKRKLPQHTILTIYDMIQLLNADAWLLFDLVYHVMALFCCFCEATCMTITGSTVATIQFQHQTTSQMMAQNVTYVGR